MMRSLVKKIIFNCIFCALSFGIALHGEIFAQEKSFFPKRQWVSKKVRIFTFRGEVVFEIHGDRERLAYLNRVAEILEKKSLPILEYFDYPPSNPIQFILVPESSHFNGSAQLFPYPLVHLNLFPPFGNGHTLGGDDWIENLVLHELVHIVHLDQNKGLLKGLRNVFGTSITLLNSLNPSWFTEGIAVWAETEFTQGGRLRHNLALWETHSRLLDRSFCGTLDCLDEPGKYPYQSYPYWIGSLFLNEKEKENPGFISCIVKTYSDQIPFRHNRAYQRCFKDYRQLVLDFENFIFKKRQSLEEKAKLVEETIQKKWSDLKSFSMNSFGQPIFGKNFHLKDGKLFFIVDERQSPVGVLRDLKSEQEQLVSFPFQVDQIASSSRTSSHFLVSASARDRFEKPRQIAWIDSTNAQLGRVSKLKKGADYPFYSHPFLYFFRYEEDAWHLYRMREDEKEKREEKILSFPHLAQISRINLTQNKGKDVFSLRFYDHNQKKPYQLLSINVEKKKPSVLYQSVHPFDFLGECENQFFLKKKEELVYLKKSGSKKAHVQTLKNFWAKQIVQMRWDDQDSLFLIKDDPRKVYHWAKGCHEVAPILIQGKIKSKNKSQNVNKVKWESKETFPQGLENYSPFSYMKPYWWMIDYLNENKTIILKARTSLQDPASKHILNLSLGHYFNLSKYTLEGDYAYSLYKNKSFYDVNGQLSLVTGHEHSYQKMSSVDYLASMRKIYTGLKGKFRMPSLDYSFFLGIQKEWEEHILSEGRGDVFQYSWNHAVERSGILTKSFWTSFKLGHHFSRDIEEKNQQGWSQIIFAENKIQPLRGLYFHFWGSYGKRKRASEKSSLLKAGGLGSSLFPFYGVENGNALGSEVQTYRLDLELELFRIYRAPIESLPFYFKKINFIAGVDYLKADLIYLGNSQEALLNEKLWGYHYGMSSSTTLLYRIPLTFDLIVNRLRTKDQGDKLQPFVIIKTSFLF